jgi:hypothetical protein
MTTESQLIFNVVFSVAMVLLGWILNSLRDSIKALHDSDVALTIKVQGIEVLVAGQYIKRDEFTLSMEKLSHILVERLDRIDGKLDSKADKSTCSAIHNA